MATISSKHVRYVTRIVYFPIHFNFAACHISFHLEANWGEESRHCEPFSRGSSSLDLTFSHRLSKTQFSLNFFFFLKASCRSFLCWVTFVDQEYEQTLPFPSCAFSTLWTRVLGVQFEHLKIYDNAVITSIAVWDNEVFAFLGLSLWEHSGKFQAGRTNWRQSYFLEIRVIFFKVCFLWLKW